MKQVITLNHHMDGYNDMMFNLSIQYGIRYDEAETKSGYVMLFTIREELEDRRTYEYFQDVLCYIFNTEPSNYRYDSPSTSQDVSIYTILLAFVDCMRKQSNERHYKEKIKRFHEVRRVDMMESVPKIHLLTNGKYSLTPTEHYQIGYDVRERLAPHKLKGNIQIQSKTRDKNRRAVYRNFNWENLYESCSLYRDFCDGKDLEDTEQVFLIARNLCGAEKGKQHFLDIISEHPENSLYANMNWREILTAIIKGNIPLAPCQQCDYCDCCRHAENMLSTAKPQRFEVRQLRNEKYVSLEEVSLDLQSAFEKAINAHDNSAYIIKAQTGAGKTETYLQYMKRNTNRF